MKYGMAEWAYKDKYRVIKHEIRLLSCVEAYYCDESFRPLPACYLSTDVHHKLHDEQR